MAWGARLDEPQTSEEALRESEERFRGAFHYSPIGMGIASLDGRFVRVNPALCRIQAAGSKTPERMRRCSFGLRAPLR